METVVGLIEIDRGSDSVDNDDDDGGGGDT